MTDFDPADLLARVRGELAPIFTSINWAEDEITQAQERHPDSADLLYHTFPLLTPDPRMELLTKTEFCYRAHCRELLERVAAGQDTQPGTDAELACTLSEASMSGPLTTQAVTLYMRVWARAFPEQAERVFGADAAEHYEYVASGVDEAERDLRRKLTQPGRTMPDGCCEGLHHGEPAPNCPLRAERNQP